jgi:NOL1/NOP2/fmu family ribosome biogenesis protein
MTESEAKKTIREAGKSWQDFLEWMRGQTVGMAPDGTTDWYPYDVNRFCRGSGPMSHG